MNREFTVTPTILCFTLFYISFIIQQINNIILVLRIKKYLLEVAMKAKTVKAMVVLTVLAVIMGISSMGFSHSEAAGEIKEVSGEILLKLPGGYYLKPASGDEYRLMLGPPWFLEEIGLDLKNGEKVSVEGMDDGYNIILVSSITKGTKTYEIFDADAVSGDGDYGCGRMSSNDHHRGWGNGYHGMWGPNSRGLWNRSGYSRRDNNRGGMMQSFFSFGKERRI
jgi:hypothetical protein